jgi:hypothetical protein
MFTQKTVKIIIRKDGSIEVDFQGFRGRMCETEFEKLAAVLEQLGVKLSNTEKKHKPEYYVTETHQERLRVF